MISSWILIQSPAMFLFNLGLKPQPPADLVLGIAAAGGPATKIALNYFLDLFSRGDPDYTSYRHKSISFIPAMHNRQKKLLKPSEVCSQPDWHLLGFPILDPTLTRKNELIIAMSIKGWPSTSDLLELLKITPPSTYEQAHEWFKILSQRVSGLCNGWLNECLY